MPEQRDDNPAPEIIGAYPVHPTASLFPLLEGEAYDDLKKSIEGHGQQEPIVVHRGLLVDGRNRLKILLELGRQPIVQEYSGTLTIEDFILVQNLFRRHLTDGQRMMITTEVMLRKETVAAAERKQAAGKKHGRGHRELPLKSGEGSSGRHAGEAASRIAAAAKGTRYQAEQAIAVATHAPELADKVKTGEIPLKEAARAANERRASRPRLPGGRREPDYRDAETKLVGRIHDAMKTFPRRRGDLRKAILAAVEQWKTEKTGHAA